MAHEMRRAPCTVGQTETVDEALQAMIAEGSLHGFVMQAVPAATFVEVPIAGAVDDVQVYVFQRAATCALSST
jgi:hypothetical protein